MAFNVQNDAGTVTNANAYITVAEFKTYHDDRGNSYGDPVPADSVIERAIVRATDYVDTRFNYIGELPPRYATAWPRISAIDPTGYLISGVPPAVKEACAEYALRALDGSLFPDPERDTSGRLLDSKTEKVGPIESSVTYSAASGSVENPIYPVADLKLTRAGLVNTRRQLSRG